MGAFLLGIGCQKGGTSWLFDYLAGHPQVDLGPRKEMHVLDALFVPRMRNQYTRVFNEVHDHVRDPEAHPLRLGTATVAAALLDLTTYFDHFHYRLLRNPDVRLTGEITPAYAAVPAEVMAFVREEMTRRGVPLKVLFVMRDPVERCWSQLRMSRRDNPEAPFPASAVAHLQRIHATEPFQLRTRYDRTLSMLDAVFAPSEVHVALYEQLLTPAGIRGLCAFLGLDDHAPDLDRRVHGSPPYDDLPEEVVAEVATTYRAAYVAAARRFSEAVIETHWPSMSQVLVG